MLFALSSIMTVGLAQDRQNFKTLSIGIFGGTTISVPSINKWYSLPNSSAIEFGSNFWNGYLFLRTEMAEMKSRGIVPSYSDYHCALGYNYTYKFHQQFSWINSVSIGNAYMVFNETPGAGNLRESEMMMQLASNIEWRPAYAQWGVSAGAGWKREFTKTRIDFTNVTIGVRYYFNTPQWFGRVMK
ncbi:MAG: hypothetical protein Q8M15_04225 [Bacteroidota bacterium]|nr:hypothetical protein [Bacteroidota bacterium]